MQIAHLCRFPELTSRRWTARQWRWHCWQQSPEQRHLPLPVELKDTLSTSFYNSVIRQGTQFSDEHCHRNISTKFVVLRHFLFVVQVKTKKLQKINTMLHNVTLTRLTSNAVRNKETFLRIALCLAEKGQTQQSFSRRVS